MKINWKKLLVTIGIVLTTAGVVGGLMWYGLASAISEQKDQIDRLDQRVSKLSTAYAQKLEEKKEAERQVAEEAAKSTANTTPTKKSTPESTPIATPQIYFLYSPACGTCQAQIPIVNELAAEGIPFVWLDVQAHPEYISQYGISAVPTFILNGHKETAYFTKAELLNFWNTYK